jgi:hypothetical protein
LLVHDSLSKKLEFTFNIFDIDGDGEIGRNDMRTVITTKLLLKNKKKGGELSKEEKKEVDAEVKEIYPTEVVNNYLLAEFKTFIEKQSWIDELIAMFQIIPSPFQECKIILKEFKEATVKEGDTFYVISNEWYRSWKLYVSNCTGSLDLQRFNENGLIEQFEVIVHKSKPRSLKSSKDKVNKGSIILPSEDIENNELSVDATTRPGEITNSELSDPFQGSLKYGLMVIEFIND